MEAFINGFTIFVLAIFVGFEVITKVPPTLHTPLMSGSNAISGITLIGAILSAGSQQTLPTTILGFTAVVLLPSTLWVASWLRIVCSKCSERGVKLERCLFSSI